MVPLRMFQKIVKKQTLITYLRGATMKRIVLAALLLATFTRCCLFSNCFKTPEEIKREMLENFKHLNPTTDIVITLKNFDTRPEKSDFPKICRTIPANEIKHSRWTLAIVSNPDKAIQISNRPEITCPSRYDVEYAWYIKPIKTGTAKVRAIYHSLNKDLEQTQEISINVTE